MAVQEQGVPSLFVIPLILLFVGALLFIALLYGQHDLIVLTLLILGIMAGAWLWASRSLSRLRCSLTVDRQRVFPGEDLTLRLNVENSKLLPIWLWMRVPAAGLLRSPSDEGALTKESSLLWYQRVHFEWSLTALRRGVYQIGPLHLQAGDLFSFFSKYKRSETFYSIIVYPRLVPLKPISLPRQDFFGVPRARSPVQDPVYILGTRDYQSGQPAKYIHWKASARHNRLQEKIFESTHQEKILLVLNVDLFARHRAEEDFERTLEVIASLAVQLDEQGHSVGFVTNGKVKGGGSTFVPTARNPQQIPAILELLARLEMKADSDFRDVLSRRLALSWGIGCICFSCQEEDLLSTKEYLAWRKTPAVFLVSRSHVRSAEEPSRGPGKIYRLEDVCSRGAENR
jgi:uncharacterized protein (DUF58 family)